MSGVIQSPRYRQDLLLIVIIILISTVFSVAYYLYNCFRKKSDEELSQKHWRDKYTMRFLIMLVCPFIGPLFLGLSHIFFKLIRRDTHDWSYAEFAKTKEETPEIPLPDKELNIVPIKEALAISDTKRLRRLLLDILKDEDVDSSISSVALALESEDSETSHYAASVLMDTISRFQNAAFALRDHLLESPEDAQSAEKLSDLIFYYVSTGIFSDYENRNYTKIADTALENLYNIDSKAITPDLFLGITEAALSSSMNNEADKWSRRAFKTYPDSLQAYKAVLKYCYKNGEIEKFFGYLGKLKKSDVIIDSETLELIRTLA